MTRHHRFARWLMLVCSAALLPAFILRCDKAALNLQRGFFDGLGFNIAAQLVDSGMVELQSQ